jgi:4-carboxymuconolactone decarboxylase
MAPILPASAGAGIRYSPPYSSRANYPIAHCKPVCFKFFAIARDSIMTRFKQPEYEKLTDEQRRVYDEIASGPRGGVRGPLAVWLTRPELADKAQKLGKHVRYKTTLSPRLSELAILLTARIWASEFEWWAHQKNAEKAGVDQAIIEAIRIGKRPAYKALDEQAVHDFTVSLHINRNVSDDVYRRTIEVLGEEGVVDLVGILGYYTLISMTINVFHVEVPLGEIAKLPKHSIDELFC